jgi:alkylhydroperoxidase family enzyme
VPPDRVARVLDALEHLHVAGDREVLARSGELTAPRKQLVEVLAAAIDGAADELSGHATRLLRGTGSAAEVRAGVAELSGLLDLLDRVEKG